MQINRTFAQLSGGCQIKRFETKYRFNVNEAEHQVLNSQVHVLYQAQKVHLRRYVKREQMVLQGPETSENFVSHISCQCKPKHRHARRAPSATLLITPA